MSFMVHSSFNISWESSTLRTVSENGEAENILIIQIRINQNFIDIVMVMNNQSLIQKKISEVQTIGQTIPV